MKHKLLLVICGFFLCVIVRIVRGRYPDSYVIEPCVKIDTVPDAPITFFSSPGATPRRNNDNNNDKADISKNEKFNFSHPLAPMFQRPCILMADTRPLFSDTLLNYVTATTMNYAVRHNYHFLFYQIANKDFEHEQKQPSNANKNSKTMLACSHPLHGPRAAPWCKLLAILHALSLQDINNFPRVVHDALPNHSVVENQASFCSAIIWIDSDGVLKGPTSLLVRILTHPTSHPASWLDFNKHHVFIGNNRPYDWFPNTGFFFAKNSHFSRQFFFHWWDDNVVPQFYNAHDYEQRWLVKVFLENLPLNEYIGFFWDLAPMNSSRWGDEAEPVVHVCSHQMKQPQLLVKFAEVLLEEIGENSAFVSKDLSMNATTWDPSKTTPQQKAMEALPKNLFNLLHDHQRSQGALREAMRLASQHQLFFHFSVDGYKFGVGEVPYVE